MTTPNPAEHPGIDPTGSPASIGAGEPVSASAPHEKSSTTIETPTRTTTGDDNEFESLAERYYEVTDIDRLAEDIDQAATRPLLPTSRPAGVLGNRIMSALAKGSAWGVLALLGAVAVFLVVLAWPALTDPNLQLRPMGSPEKVGLIAFTLPQIFGTVLGSLLALTLSMPLALGVAIALTQYLPIPMRKTLGYLVDLLAAVPSVVYGLWGALFLLPLLQPIQQGLGDWLGFIPLFAGPVSATGRTMFATGVVLAIMILPIITAVIREVMESAPRDQVEGALGLGATHWEVVRMVVMPHSRSGIGSAAMLGLGRALGETMAVVMILSIGSSMTWSLLQAGRHSTIAANIALQFPESAGIYTSALVATGLALFAITLVVNTAARMIVARAANNGKKKGKK